MHFPHFSSSSSVYAPKDFLDTPSPFPQTHHPNATAEPRRRSNVYFISWAASPITQSINRRKKVSPAKKIPFSGARIDSPSGSNFEKLATREHPKHAPGMTSLRNRLMVLFFGVRPVETTTPQMGDWASVWASSSLAFWAEAAGRD